MQSGFAETGLTFELGEGIRVTASDDPSSPVLRRFFTGYDRAFVLPDEREELAGFEACLALNATHHAAFGRRHREMVVVLETAGGTLLGGANFLATAIGRGPRLPPVSVALNYVYVEEAARGRGLLRHALTAVRRLALGGLGFDPQGPAPTLFIEQNDPLRLTEAEYALDSRHSGLDQVDRLAIWARVGARIVDFPYVQPPLSADQQADDGLVYAAVDYPGDSVDPALLHDHFESFFAISVLKGRPEPEGGVARAQLAALAALAARGADRDVALLDLAPALAWLREGRPTAGFDSLRALARAAAA